MIIYQMAAPNGAAFLCSEADICVGREHIMHVDKCMLI